MSSSAWLPGVILVISAALLLSGTADPPEKSEAHDWKLKYTRPASQWVEALPLGNGRLGAMVYGGVAEEHLQFNDDTLWTGRPHEYHHEGAVKHLPAIRQFLWEGKQREAEALAAAEFMSVPLRQSAYQPFGDLRVHFPGHENAEDYRRQLDIDAAMATIRYRVADVTFQREAFVTHPDQVLILHLTASRRGALRFTAKLDSPHKTWRTHSVDKQTIALTGQAQEDGVKFESRLRVIVKGGERVVDEDAIEVKDADSATLMLAAATSFKSYRDLSADPAERCENSLNAAARKTFEALRNAHVQDHRRLFRRVSIDLGRTTAADRSTDQRLKFVANSDDPQLAALFFQYGRYLLIASSRPGDQPANLQGIWNDQLKPPWESKWTTNINAEMNYWPAEAANLSECHEPLFDLIGDLVATGRKTAQAHYGCRGWVLHHNTDLWRGTAPINASNHGIWVTGGAWLCRHLWEHYVFTGDRRFLEKRAYPVMKEAALFFVDFLVKDPKTGWLVSTPSNSPEQGGLVAGPTMDHQIIRALFANTIEAARTLKVDAEFAAKLVEIIPQIAPNQIGKHGQLQEWLEDKDDPNNRHRHVSHLWGLYPGDEITLGNPELFAAAKRSLHLRGDGGTGWSKAWKINLWARLLDGDHAHRLLIEALAGNTYPNLFDAHPPFQIDGNFGATAGMAEMLLQSHRGEIHLLPALPKSWRTGSVTGLCARGGFLVDMYWTEGKLTRAVIRSRSGRTCKVRYSDKVRQFDIRVGNAVVLDGQLERAS